VAATNPQLLAFHKITHIVSVLKNHPSTGLHHITIPLDDSHVENVLVHFLRVCDFIDEAVAGGGVVFVHCRLGVSRSASFVVAYREHGFILVLLPICVGVRQARADPFHSDE
jgi:dual specificity phosphatase 12